MRSVNSVTIAVFVISIILVLVFSLNYQKVLLSPPSNSICPQLSCSAPYSGYGFSSEVTDKEHVKEAAARVHDYAMSDCNTQIKISRTNADNYCMPKYVICIASIPYCIVPKSTNIQVGVGGSECITSCGATDSDGNELGDFDKILFMTGLGDITVSCTAEGSGTINYPCLPGMYITNNKLQD